MNTLTVPAISTPARSQPNALKPPLPPQVRTKSRQPCPELPACHTQSLVPGEQGPKDGDCPDCESSTSPGIHLKDNVRLRETSRHFGQHLEGSQWCLGLCFWKPSAGGGDRGTVPKTAALGTSNREEPDARQRRNQSKRPGLGVPAAQGAQEDPQYSPICFWKLVFGQSFLLWVQYSSRNQVS